MRCQWREGKERSGNAIGEMTALRWEPTHITKYCPRVVPLQASTEWSSLMSIVPISTGRSRSSSLIQSTDRKELGQSFLPLGSAEWSRDKGDREGCVYSFTVNCIGVLYSQYSELIYW